MPAKKSQPKRAKQTLNKKAMKSVKGGLLPAVQVNFETQKVVPTLTPTLSKQINF